MLSPLSDVVANITLAHCDAVGRGHPLHQFCVETNNQDGLTGMVVAPENGDALAAAMRRRFDDQKLAKKFGENARQRYLTNFTAERIANAHTQLYDRVAGREDELDQTD